MAFTTRLQLIAVAACLAAGCSTSSHVLVGTPRPAISPDSVRVYLQPPPRYEEIATLNASSQGSLALTGQQNMDKAMQRMKNEAAKLGANGILLQGVADHAVRLDRRGRRRYELRQPQRRRGGRRRRLRAHQQGDAGHGDLRTARGVRAAALRLRRRAGLTPAGSP